MTEANLYYISFATDACFLGATVVMAKDKTGALSEANRLGINPGGEAAILDMPPNLSAAGLAEMLSYRNRLVTKDELLSNGAQRVGDAPCTVQDGFNREATIVCEDCNQ